MVRSIHHPRELKHDPPPAPGGRHRWLFTAAAQMLRRRVSPPEIARVLDAEIRTAGRAPQRNEVEDAIAAAARLVGASPLPPAAGAAHVTTAPKWPAPDPDLIARAEREGIAVEDLIARSPASFETRAPFEILSMLFAPDALLCVGPDNAAPIVKTLRDLETLIRRDGAQFIVPSPMSAVWGMTKSGKRSHRALENTGPRRFAVVEWDDGATLDVQASRLWFMARAALFPLALAMLSGGKSLHGWFLVAGAEEAEVLRFYREAARFGCDTAGNTPNQWARVPDGLRDNGNPQSVVFLNPPTSLR